MIEFSVNDMTCASCSSTITRAISGVDSNSKVEIDLNKKSVQITSAKPASEFLQAIREAGYTPVVGSLGTASNAPSCCQS